MANNDGNVPVVPIVPPPPAIQPQIPPVAPVVNPVVNQINVPHAQAVQGPNGLQLQVEKAKLPEFWGQKDKTPLPQRSLLKGSIGMCKPMDGLMRKPTVILVWLFVDPPTLSSNP